GTFENFKEISFDYNYSWADGALQDPIRISSYWLYKFHGDPNVYGQWRYVGPGIDGNALSYLKVGEGWTMKGSHGDDVAIEERQNYPYRGISNYADFSLFMVAHQNYLVVDPFPSAIDAIAFIDGDFLVIGAAMYFLSLLVITNSNILKEY